MLDTPTRNLAFLSGLAWQSEGRWLLKQRAPLAMALPFTLAPGVREPGIGEPVDLIGRMDPVGGLHVVAESLSRAARTSFPPRLEWRVQGVHQHDTDGIQAHGFGRGWEETDLAASLLEHPEIPKAVVACCEKDIELARWATGTAAGTRLLNRVMVTGFIDSISTHENPYATRPEKALFSNVMLRVGPGEDDVLLARLTADVPQRGTLAKRLRDSRRSGVTIIGQFLAKVKPRDDDPSQVASIEYHLRMQDALLPTAEDFPVGRPTWAPSFEAAAVA